LEKKKKKATKTKGSTNERGDLCGECLQFFRRCIRNKGKKVEKNESRGKEKRQKVKPELLIYF